MTTEQYSIGYDAGYQDGFDAALAEPVKQEPAAYFLDVKAGCSSKPSYEQVPDEYKNDADVFPLYAAPIERQWVDLTDYEIVRLYAESPMCDSEMIDFARAVIAAFKEKNE